MMYKEDSLNFIGMCLQGKALPEEIDDYIDAFPGCFALLADADGDGDVTLFDIDPFVQILTGP